MMLVTLELKASKLLNTPWHKRLDCKKHKFMTQNLIFTFQVIFRWNGLFFHTKLRYRKLKLILIYF